MNGALKGIMSWAAAATASETQTVPFPQELLEPLPPIYRSFVVKLDAQTVRGGIDYRTLGQGWSHPTERIAYRLGNGRSFHKSAKRQAASRQRLEALATLLADADSDGKRNEAAMIESFCTEIGAPALAANATWPSVVAAVESELAMPLRSLAEGIENMTKTFNGKPVPRAPIEATVDAILRAVLGGRFSEWRYTNPVGRHQLEGLPDAAVAIWREPTAIEHSSLVMTHEDSEGELGFFWATKIGGPSHGFDLEGQCLLPLLANARHKVVLVTDKAWPHHPAGRAHLRLLWVNGAKDSTDAAEYVTGAVVLFLETVNADFAASREGAVRPSAWQLPVLRHALSKARRMGVGLSVEAHLKGELEKAVEAEGAGGAVSVVSDRLVLRPSNGVVEASDYLTNKHDWVQLEEEVTGPLKRALWRPDPSSAPSKAEL